ncbi:hypothetical protein K9M42_02585 [Patescibacteria group bacterium]|nr:hypothetical protein [Patescibacteria group bacterium]
MNYPEEVKINSVVYEKIKQNEKNKGDIKMDFKPKILRNADIAVHCPEKWQAQALLKWACKNNRIWGDIEATFWDEFEENTYYCVASGTFYNEPTCCKKILTFEEAILVLSKNKTNIKQHFIHFMKQKGIYEKFIGCYELYPNPIFIGTIEKLYKTEMPKLWIDWALSWDKTKDGHSYWRKVQSEWYQYLKKLNTSFIHLPSANYSIETLENIIEEHKNK